MLTFAPLYKPPHTFITSALTHGCTANTWPPSCQKKRRSDTMVGCTAMPPGGSPEAGVQGTALRDWKHVHAGGVSREGARQG